MVKRCIGIDISSHHLHAVQMSRNGGEFVIEKVFSAQTRRSTDHPAQILRSLFNQQGFDHRAEIVISLSHDAVFFRNIQLRSDELEQIRLRGSSILDYHFPISPDDCFTQIFTCQKATEEKFSVLTAAVSKGTIRERLNLFSEAKITVKLLDTTISAIHSLVSVNYPQISNGAAIIAYVDNRYLVLAVTRDGHILAVRNMPINCVLDNDAYAIGEWLTELLSREIEITWKRVFNNYIQPDDQIYLIVSGNIHEHLNEPALSLSNEVIKENLNSDVIVVDLSANVKTLPNCKADLSTYAIAEGLALRGLVPEKTSGINFLKANEVNMKPALDLKKELKICAALLAACAVLWVAGLFLRLSKMEAEYSRIKNEIREVFQSALPQEQNIVSPLTQLEQKLASFPRAFLEKQEGRPLDVLHSLTASIPSQAHLKVDDLLIAADTVRVNGTCDSFESVYQWQRQLRELPDFRSVEAKDIQKEPHGSNVGFNMLLSHSTSSGQAEALKK
jgi:Tfp pilus assembly PilM family ATPase/Tfp pilus assembly protein PilN